MKDCTFCKIVKGEMESEIVYQDDDFCVFKDVNPKAPIHLLIVPKKHIKSVNELDEVNLAGKLVLLAKKLAQKQGIAKSGYRLIINTGPDSGQIVDHLHLHLFGGRPL